MNNSIVVVECGADLDNDRFPFTRKHYYYAGCTNEFRKKYNNIGVYQTIMHYINPIWFQDQKGRWLVNARDSYKYGDFYLDFDTVIESEEDYQKIKEDVYTSLKYLRLFLEIDISSIQFYFSGNKGIHLTVPAEVIGLKPHLALNQIYKEMAQDISRYCKHETLDIRVYDDKRMFRMVNSINRKSGLYKIPLSPDEFKNLSYQEITELAKSPKAEIKRNTLLSPKAKKMFDRYVKEWTERVHRQKEFTGKIKELKTTPPCIDAMLNKIFKETIDERNNSATALTSFFYQQGVEREEAMIRIKRWNEENCQPSLKEREIEATVNSVYNNQYRYGCHTFERLSGVCDKDKCPLFHKEIDQSKEK